MFIVLNEIDPSEYSLRSNSSCERVFTNVCHKHKRNWEEGIFLPRSRKPRRLETRQLKQCARLAQLVRALTAN